MIRDININFRSSLFPKRANKRKKWRQVQRIKFINSVMRDIKEAIANNVIDCSSLNIPTIRKTVEFSCRGAWRNR